MSLLTDLVNLNLSDTTDKIIAEYIWCDRRKWYGYAKQSQVMFSVLLTEPVPFEQTLTGPVTDPSKLPKWNYDGSSTGQAPGADSEVIL
ncbi:hypothetical protein GW17_00016658 [Ensete ventricosum]|nr:hypothetical protein GW17_00016658 [Ensete ventricosum]